MLQHFHLRDLTWLFVIGFSIKEKYELATKYTVDLYFINEVNPLIQANFH